MKKYFNIKKIGMFMVAIIGFFMIKDNIDVVNASDEKHICEYESHMGQTNSEIGSIDMIPEFGVHYSFTFDQLDDNNDIYNFTSSDIGDQCPNFLLYKEIGETHKVYNLNGYGSNYFEIKNNLYSGIDLEIFDRKDDFKFAIMKLQYDYKIGNNTTVVDTDPCVTVGVVSKYIKIIFNIIRFLVPTVIIIYSVIDFAGVVVSGEQDSMEKAKKHFIQRIIIGVLILLVPSILNIILKLAGIIDRDIMEYFCTSI